MTTPDAATYVYFDLETGGLESSCDILQISAVRGELEFDQYVKPTQDISAEASAVSKLTVEDGELKYKGEAVQTVPIKEALEKFIDFVKPLGKPVLVAHNGKHFDVPFMKRYLTQNNLWESFMEVVGGFVDTLDVFRAEHPGLDSYKQVDLMAHFLNEDYEAHNSLEDVRALQKLSNETVVETFPKYTFTEGEITSME